MENIYKALVKFQGLPKEIKRTAVNPHFKNRYAPLGEILNAIREPLSECGLAVIQFPEDDDYLTTKVIHESGEFVECRFQMRPTNNSPQQKGSALTYQKRYALNAILALDAEDDDDGNSSSTDVKEKEWLNEGTQEWTKIVARLKTNPNDLPKVMEHYRINKKNREQLEAICKK
jgi:hypothetical protein